MRKPALAIALTAFGSFVLVTAALAASIISTGKVSGAPDSVVRLKVVKNGAKLVEVRAFRVTKAPAHCDGGAGTVSQRFGKALPINASGRFSGKVVSSGGPGGFFKLSGKVKNGGRKVTGTLSIDKSFNPPLGECRTGTKSWSTVAGLSY